MNVIVCLALSFCPICKGPNTISQLHRPAAGEGQALVMIAFVGPLTSDHCAVNWNQLVCSS